MRRTSHHRLPSRRPLGFSLIELLVALTIGLFLMLGFTSIFVNFKRSFVGQDALAQLQDGERLAMSVLTTAVQTAGYFPDPLDSTLAASFPARADATYGAMVAGQSIMGITGASGASDTLTARFVSASGDGLLDCLGQTNSSGSKQSVVNIFKVTSANELACSVDGGTTFVPLVSNVTKFSVTYLADTDPDASDEAFKYHTATAVGTATLWPKVKAVRLTLSFVNPYANDPDQPAAISWTQTISLMNKT